MKSLLSAAIVFSIATSVLAQAPGDDVIRTPAPPATPRINGARVYGAHPGHPFLFHVPVTGERPISISAQGLPAGLILDGTAGNITGSVAAAGDYEVTLTASNAKGAATSTLRIKIGDALALTPPMGWNSWNCFHGNINQDKIRAAAAALVASGLIDHGFSSVNMDDKWEADARDAAGNIQSSPTNFPDMKAMVDSIHGEGLRVGIYSSPGPRTCAGAIASYDHEDQDAATWAGWGIDYLKYDWCSYGSIAEQLRARRYEAMLSGSAAAAAHDLALEKAVLMMKRYNWHPESLPQTDEVKAMIAKLASLTKEDAAKRVPDLDKQLGSLYAEARKAAPEKFATIEVQLAQEPYVKMRASLDKVDRDIVFSYCQYGMGKVWEWGQKLGGNLWRTTGDIAPRWESVAGIGFRQNGLESFAGPGHWNDPDMLEIGNGTLTPDENYTHMTLWCMLSAPLLIGCDMTKMSPLTTSILGNDEVIAVNQDALGRQGWRATQNGQQEVWMKPLADGSLAVAFFNRADAPAGVSAQWSDLKLTGPQTLRDLWRQKDAGRQESGYSVKVAAHGAELFKVSPVK